MSDDHGDSSHTEALVAKCIALVCLFCATALFGGIPFLLNHYFKWTDKNSNARSAKVVTYMLHFGGGVLLATTFIHLLPEVQEVVEHLQESGELPKVKFALPETLMCAGFILMYLIEECIHSYLHRHKKAVLRKDDGVGAAFERGHSVRRSTLVKGVLKTKDQLEDDDSVDSEDSESSEGNVRVSKSTLTTVTSVSSHNIHQNGATFPAVVVDGSKPRLDLDLPICAVVVEPVQCKSHKYTLDHSLEHAHNPSFEHSHNYAQQHGHSHGGHGHSHLPIGTSDSEDVVTSSFRGLGIVLALSLHEVFEGLAIGLQEETSSVWFLFGAVAAHKLVLAFCVGVELIVARTRPILALVYSITFAIVTPIGIGIGIVVSHNSAQSGDGMVSMVLQGIACGTLLYVVFFEILSKQHAGFGAFLAMVIGFGLMFGLQNIGEGHDHHGHEHHDHDHHDHDHEHEHDAIMNSTALAAAALKNMLTESY